MNNNRQLRIFLTLIVFLLAGGVAQAQVPTVFVSILPQKYLVQQICGDKLAVEVMVQPGANPATYEPRPSQMAKLSKSKAFFAIGVPFENTWLEKIAEINPAMRIVHTDEGVEKIPMAAHFHEGDGHGHEAHEADSAHEGEEHHGIPDPHIWLAPRLVEKQLSIIASNLSELFPEQAAFFSANSERLKQEVQRTDAQVRELLRDSSGSQFMVFHPSWGYFAREYNLHQVPVELEGKEPKPAQLQELVEHAREKNIRVIFAQPQFSQKSAKIIAREIGGEVVIADPLALDWPANLLEVAQKIKEAAR